MRAAPILFAFALAACAASTPEEPPPAPAAEVDLTQPEQVFRAVCLDQIPDFAGSEAALDAAGIRHARDAEGTLVGQASGLGVLIVGTVTPDDRPATGCLVESGGAFARYALNLRSIIGARSDAVTETAVTLEGLEGLAWQWREAERTVLAELFHDPDTGTAKMLLTVPREAG